MCSDSILHVTETSLSHCPAKSLSKCLGVATLCGALNGCVQEIEISNGSDLLSIFNLFAHRSAYSGSLTRLLTTLAHSAGWRIGFILEAFCSVASKRNGPKMFTKLSLRPFPDHRCRMYPTEQCSSPLFRQYFFCCRSLHRQSCAGKL